MCIFSFWVIGLLKTCQGENDEESHQSKSCM